MVRKLKELDAQQQLDFIKSAFIYIQNAINLTNKEIPPIFTKVSKNVNHIAMTIADRIRIEEREMTTLEHIKGLLEEGLDANFIAKAFKIPVKKVQDIIQKIKDSSN